MENAKSFLEVYTGKKASAFFPLPQSGSSRKNYIAEFTDTKYVVTTNENIQENESFFYFSEVFSEHHLNTPAILKISEDRKMYIQEYLGNKTLSQIIEEEGNTDYVKGLVKKSLQKLMKLQKTVRETIDYSRTFEYEKYDYTPISHDLNYFKFFFADILEIPYHKSRLLKEFQKLASEIENLQPRSLMIRDFQSRNIMVDNNNDVFFIDYQSAMEGPLMYDVVSLLYQAKANFSQDFKKEMLDYYYSFFSREESSLLQKSLMPIRLIRNLQVLGAYGFRGLIQRKEHFIQSIANGITNLKATAEEWDRIKEYPELYQLIIKLHSVETTDKINRFNKNI